MVQPEPPPRVARTRGPPTRTRAPRVAVQPGEAESGFDREATTSAPSVRKEAHALRPGEQHLPAGGHGREEPLLGRRGGDEVGAAERVGRRLPDRGDAPGRPHPAGARAPTTLVTTARSYPPTSTGSSASGSVATSGTDDLVPVPAAGRRSSASLPGRTRDDDAGARSSWSRQPHRHRDTDTSVEGVSGPMHRSSHSARPPPRHHAPPPRRAHGAALPAAGLRAPARALGSSPSRRSTQLPSSAATGPVRRGRRGTRHRRQASSAHGGDAATLRPPDAGSRRPPPRWLLLSRPDLMSASWPAWKHRQSSRAPISAEPQSVGAACGEDARRAPLASLAKTGVDVPSERLDREPG
jgi:hypothetical protein